MRALVVGAVEGTQVALRTIAACQGWSVCGVMTLPLDKAGRHSDFVDLTDDARAAGARLIPVSSSNSPEACAAVTELAPDYVFVVGWSQICGPEFRQAAGGRVVGYHPAPLPRLRGRAALPWTIILDEKITASTLFWIDDGVDSGDILAQEYFHVAPRETASSLYAKHMTALRTILQRGLASIASGEDMRRQQDETCATYATRRVPEDGRIDWAMPAAAIDRLVRATGRPYPGAFTEYREQRIVIHGSQIRLDPGIHAIPGQIVARGDGRLSVVCGDGAILDMHDFECEGELPPQHAVLGRPQ